MWPNSAYSWNRNPQRRRSGSRRTPGPSQTSSPQRTEAWSARSRPAIARSALVLPAPDGPASARHSPGATSSARSSANARSGWRSSADSIARGEFDREQESGADGDQHRAQRERGREVGREALVDRERSRLGDTAKRAGEHQRGAELTQRA